MSGSNTWTALGSQALQLREPVEEGAQSLPIRIRAELGERPSVEVIYLAGRLPGTVALIGVQRAQEGSSAQAWPVGSALAFVLADDEPTGERTVYLSHALAADASELDLKDAYHRLRLDDEILWDFSLLGDRVHVANSERGAFQYRVLRGREGTAAAPHAAGATVTALAPGES